MLVTSIPGHGVLLSRRRMQTIQGFWGGDETGGSFKCPVLRIISFFPNVNVQNALIILAKSHELKFSTKTWVYIQTQIKHFFRFKIFKIRIPNS